MHYGTGEPCRIQAPQTTSDQGQIPSENTRNISSEPVSAVPGPIVVYSAPSPVPTKTQSELLADWER